jgi:hypothetical protein
LQFSQTSHESQNCLRSEQHQTFYEFINIEAPWSARIFSSPGVLNSGVMS